MCACVFTQRKGGPAGKKGGVPKTAGPKPTVASQFKNSLMVLVEKMSACNPHFVRCIKPNHQKRPGLFTRDYITAQLRYTGMLETTRIRREGYAVRIEFAEFVDRSDVNGAHENCNLNTSASVALTDTPATTHPTSDCPPSRCTAGTSCWRPTQRWRRLPATVRRFVRRQE